jgi:hypothetical protein
MGFLAADKTMAVPVTWAEADGNLQFTVPLDIEAVTEEGLWLFGRANAALPEREVTLGLRWVGVPSRFEVFDRFDRRPIGGHNNKGLGPRELRFRPFDGTHRHPLDVNAALAIGLLRAMAENLPVAVPVEPDPAIWRAFLATVADQYRIHDLVTAPPPPWQYELLALSAGDGRQGRKRGRGG